MGREGSERGVDRGGSGERGRFVRLVGFLGQSYLVFAAGVAARAGRGINCQRGGGLRGAPERVCIPAVWRGREYLSKEDNITLEKPFDVTSFRKLVKDRVIMAKGMMASRTETGSSGSTVRGSGGSGP
jgi:hypothetical protein